MKYTRINENTEYDSTSHIVKVNVDGVDYKSCALCERFYKIDGHNTKYCPDCRDKAKSLKTVEEYKAKQLTKV